MDVLKVKKGKSTSISQFQKQCKTYFSSVSARGCKYLYLNFPGYEDYLIVSNADPDMLTTYTLASMISVHLIQPKDEFLNKFRSIFTPTVSATMPYIIRTELITKSYKKDRVETVLTMIDEDTGILSIMGGGQLIQIDVSNEEEEDELSDDDTGKSLNELEQLLVDDGWDTEIKRSLFTSAHIAGGPLIDPFVEMEMDRILTQVMNDYSHCISNENNVISSDQTTLIDQIRCHANWYRTISFSGDQLGLPSHLDYRKQKLLLVDGLDIPCVSEFLKNKIIKDQFTGKFTLYIYNSVGDTAKCLACYDALDVKIISTRPYLETVLIPRKPERTIRHIHPMEISHE